MRKKNLAVLVISLACFQAVSPLLIYGNESRESKALQLATERIAQDPNNPDGYLSRAVIFNEYFKFSHAIADADRAIALKPTAAGYRLRGQIYRDSGQPVKATSDFEKACLLAPQTASNFGDLAVLEWKFHHYDKARMAYLKLLKLCPSCCIERSHLAEVYLEMHRPADALTEIKTSLKIDSDRGGKGHALLGYALLDLKQYDKALDALNFALVKDKYNFKALNARATVYERLGKKDLAERDKALLKDTFSETYNDAIFSNK